MSCRCLLCLHSLRQLGLNEVFLQLLINQLQLPKRLVNVQKTIVNGYFEVIGLQIKQS